MTDVVIGRTGLDRLLHPRSIAIVGVSPDVASTGGACLGNLERFGYAGDIHLVSRSRAEVNGRPCAATIDALPDGIDTAILALPQAGIIEALEACARRTIGAAVVFASGFSETGDAGRLEQDRLAAIARDAGMALAGPNCLGLVNYADGVPFLMTRAEHRPLSKRTAVCVLAQSGGMMMTLNNYFNAHGIDVAYAISTGNEALTTVEEYLGVLLDEPHGGPIVLFVECLRRPRLLLEYAAIARERGRPIIMLHTGRSAAARESARSHTGALAGDYAVMRTCVEQAGIVLVESLDMLLDVSAMIARFPHGCAGGLGVITESGAYKGLAIDVCEDLGIDLATLSPATIEAVAQAMPAYAQIDNPLDLTAQSIRDANLYTVAACAFVADPAIGAIVAPLMTGPTSLGKLAESGMVEMLLASDKPSTLAFIGADEPPPAIAAAARTTGYPLFTSGERALNAVKYVMRYRPRPPLPPVRFEQPLPTSALTRAAARGTLTEYEAKSLFAAAGIPIPSGRLTASADEAVEAARQIGYPVVVKAQSTALLHKSDAGGVVLDVRDAAALRAAWVKIQTAVAAQHAEIQIESMLVERMAPTGIELVVGAKRDPDWGTVLLMGLGGIWIETLGDVALVADTASHAEIVVALDGLSAAPVLKGARGTVAVDRDAVADVVMRLARLMRALPDVREMEINPLLAYDGRIVALDALVSS